MKAPETHDTEKMRGDPDGREAAAASRPAGSVGSLPLETPRRRPARSSRSRRAHARGPEGLQGQDKGKTGSVRSALQGLLPHEKRREGREEEIGSLPHLADELQGCPAGALSGPL